MGHDYDPVLHIDTARLQVDLEHFGLMDKTIRIMNRDELPPEARMTEAITFLTGLDVGHGGAVTCKAGLLPLPMNTAENTVASLTALIEQGQALLASLSAPAV